MSVRVAMKRPGDVIGEVAMLFDSPRNATVAATSEAAVYVSPQPLRAPHAASSPNGEGRRDARMRCTCGRILRGDVLVRDEERVPARSLRTRRAGCFSLCDWTFGLLAAFPLQVLDRQVYRHFAKAEQQNYAKQIEVFMSHVPLLQHLSEEVRRGGGTVFGCGLERLEGGGVRRGGGEGRGRPTHIRWTAGMHPRCRRWPFSSRLGCPSACRRRLD